ncbi:MAG: GxGYxYP family putative glycoside hydrolase [Bacteroidia bacterium]|nr:GxGYxYP family putative glycoside hydrolase [Bacteroidia bacterium]
MKNVIGREMFLLFGLLFFLVKPYCQVVNQEVNRNPQIIDYSGEEFTFAILADPQVSGKDNKGVVAVKAAKTLEQACQEINNLENMPLFTIFLGDLVNTFDIPSVENFSYCIRDLKSKPVLVHGNHDTRPPYTAYKELSKKINGFEEVYFSFDVGEWHFAAVPCNLSSNSENTNDILIWLENDLKKNAQKPTMVFEHMHLLPGGLSQLEWYTFDQNCRNKFLEILTKYKNVKYYFNGHVHNGIKASVKMGWEYRGTRFITVPTIIQGRVFNEEYPEFFEGLDNGGYYLVVHVDGKKISLEGRLAGNKNSFYYPSKFSVFKENIEPRWFKTIPEFIAGNLKNGDFSKNLDGWNKDFRYMADKDPAFIYSRKSFKKQNAAYLFTQSKPPLAWSGDERTEIFQVVSLENIKNPFLEADYAFEKEPIDGGGFIRLTAMNSNGYEFLMFFRWGAKNEYQSDYVPRSLGFELTGRSSGWNFLSDLAKNKKALFFNVDESVDNWHQLKVNIAELYNKAIGEPDAWEKLKISKLYLGLATWCNKPLEAVSSAYFTNIKLSDNKNVTSSCDGSPFQINEKIFQTTFGKGLGDKVNKGNSEPQRREARLKNLQNMKQVTVVDAGKFSEPENVLAASMQGQLAKQGIYLYLKHKNDFWLPEIEKLGIAIETEDNLQKLLEKYASRFKGYVLSDMENVRIAATVCGPMNALVVTHQTDSLAKSAGLNMLFDVSGKDEEWLYDYIVHNIDQFNLTAITQHNVGKPSTLIDYAIANNYLCMQGMGKPDLVRKYYQLIETASPKLGFGTPYRNEMKDVGLSTEEGLYTIPSANSHNLSFYAATGKLFDLKKQKKNEPTYTPVEGEKVHYVMIMMSDGDNLNFHTNGLASNNKYMNNSHCKEIPMNWMYPPEIIDIAPFLNNYYITHYPATNNLLGAVSGAGYTYPSTHKDLEKYSLKTNELLKRNGLDYCVIMDFPDFRTKEKEILAKMMKSMPDVKGLFYMDYSNYAKWKGDIYFIEGKPVISFKYRLWLPMDPLEKIADAINNAPRDPSSIEGYSTVVVHAWSYGMDDVARFVKLLNKDVKVVGAYDFVDLVNNNLKK